MSTAELVEALTKQKEAHDSFLEALQQHTKELEDELEDAREKHFAIYLFFTEHHPELIAEFVGLVYSKIPACARRKAVAVFHDETLDLSTLACTGDDFEPWKD